MLSLPIYLVGLTMDDFVHRLILRGAIPAWSSNPTQLYDFTRSPPEWRFAVEHGLFPWWIAEDFKIRFFRPLSSLSVAFDHLFDQHTTLVGHTQSLLWFFALCWIAASILRAILPEKSAITATWCYCLAAHHTSGLQWIAARNSQLAGVFGLLAVALYARALQQDTHQSTRPTLAVPAVGSLFVGLFAGETVLGALIVMMGVDRLLRPNDALSATAKRVSLPVLLGVVYLIAYSAAGYGVRWSGIYHDPAREFAQYAGHFPGRMFGLLAEPFSSIPSDFLMFGGPVARTVSIIGAVVLAVVVLSLALVRSALSREQLRVASVMLAVGAVALVPSVAGAPGSRMLPIVGFALACVVGVLLSGAREFLRSNVGTLAKLPVWIFAGFFAFSQFVISPMFRLMQPLNMGKISSVQTAVGRDTPWACNERSVLLVVASSDPGIAMYVVPILANAGHHANVSQVLSMAPTDHEVQTVDDRTFRVRSVARVSILDNPLGILYRSPALPVPLGTQMHYENLDLTVTAVNDRGPTELTVHSSAPIQAPAVCMFVWKDGALRPFALPPMGQTVIVRREIGPMGL